MFSLLGCKQLVGLMIVEKLMQVNNLFLVRLSTAVMVELLELRLIVGWLSERRRECKSSQESVIRVDT